MTYQRTVVAAPNEATIVFSREFDAEAARSSRPTPTASSSAAGSARAGRRCSLRAFEPRTGGEWSYVIEGLGGSWAFHGTFHEVTAPSRLVQTFEYEGEPGHPNLDILTFTDLPDGRSRDRWPLDIPVGRGSRPMLDIDRAWTRTSSASTSCWPAGCRPRPERPHAGRDAVAPRAPRAHPAVPPRVGSREQLHMPGEDRMSSRARVKILALIGALAATIAAPAMALGRPAAQAKWTIMVYMSGDNNLEDYIVKDLELELAAMGSTANVQITALADRGPGYDKSRGDWQSTKLYHPTQGMLADAASAVADWGERNLGDPETLPTSSSGRRPTTRPTTTRCSSGATAGAGTPAGRWRTTRRGSDGLDPDEVKSVQSRSGSSTSSATTPATWPRSRSWPCGPATRPRWSGRRNT